MKIPKSKASEDVLKNILKNTYKIVYNQNISAKKLSSNIKKAFNRKYDFLDYEEMNSIVTKLICGKISKNDLGKDSLLLSPFHINASKIKKSFVASIIKNIKSSFANYELSILLNNDQEKLIPILKNLVFFHDATNLIGTIEKSLKLIEKRLKIHKNIFTIRKFNFSKDYVSLKKILLNDARNGAGDKRLNFLEKDVQIKHESVWKRLSNKPNNGESFVICNSNKIVGGIASMYFPKGFNKKIAHIADVIIDPKFQGQGLSYILYKEALIQAK